MIGSSETTGDLDYMFQSSTVSADFQPSWVSLAVKGSIKLLPISGMEFVLARTWTGEPGPAPCNITEMEEESLLLLLCGKVLVMQSISLPLLPVASAVRRDHSKIQLPNWQLCCRFLASLAAQLN